MFQNIQEVLSNFESLVLILGVIFVVVQIRQQTRISRADHDRQKKQSTIEFYNIIAVESEPFYRKMAEKTEMTLTWETVNSDESLSRDIVRYLSRLERLAVGIASDVYDFRTLCYMSARFISAKYERLEGYITEARIEKNAPQYCEELERLAKRFEKYLKDNPIRRAEDNQVRQL